MKHNINYNYKNKRNNGGRKTHIFAKKSLGQNFLQDHRVVEEICKNAKIKGEIVLEIGAGTGFLTKEILKNNPQKMIIIEKDNRMIKGLELLCSQMEFEDKTKIINDDALKYKIIDVLNYFQTTNKKKLTLIGNLPYNIGTTLVIEWNKQIENINEIIVMLQKEVVDRIIAKPKTKDYGRVSVLIQSRCDVYKLFDVEPSCFYPQPKVMSSVVKIVPKGTEEKISIEHYNLLDEFCRIAFSQRRKKLCNVLTDTKFEDMLIKLNNIDKNIRIEELCVDKLLFLIKNKLFISLLSSYSFIFSIRERRRDINYLLN